MALAGLVVAPGRVNLIGEHIDYHNLPVLPVALSKRIRVSWRVRGDALIAASSDGFPVRKFEWTSDLRPVEGGDWENYLRAAAAAYALKWGVEQGVDLEVSTDLPPAAGLSSSSALIVAVTLALLEANRRRASFEELMDVLPEGEHFVGTRGGAMDQAAVLASRAGCATRIEFAPVGVRHVPVPQDWAFVVVDSGKSAEKSGAAREEYNARRSAGAGAPGRLGFASYRDALATGRAVEMASRLNDSREQESYLHVVTEAARVDDAVRCMESGDAEGFGRLMLESHASLRDRLRVSCVELDAIVDAAMQNGALGARLTGAGFGGCAVVLSRSAAAARLLEAFGSRAFVAEPSDGALLLNKL